MIEKKLYGWFSVQQSKVTGIVVYKDANGKEIECSLVTSTPENVTKWDDIAFLGEVTTYIRRVKEGELFEDDNKDLSEDERLLRAVKRIPRIESFFKQATQNKYRWN